MTDQRLHLAQIPPAMHRQLIAVAGVGRDADAELDRVINRWMVWRINKRLRDIEANYVENKPTD